MILKVLTATVMWLFLLTAGDAAIAVERQEPARPPVPSQPVPPAVEPPVEAPEPVAVRISGGRLRIAQHYTVPVNQVVPFVQAFFGDVTVEGTVDQDVVVIMGSVRLASTAVVHGSVIVVGGSANVDAGATVRRDFVVLGGMLNAPPDFSPRLDQVVIGSPWLGEWLQEVLPWITRGLLLGRLVVPGVEWIWYAVGIFFLVYLAVNAVFDRPVTSGAAMLVERPLSAFVTGLLVLLLTVPALAIIAATVIGLVIIPFLLCALLVIALVGKTAVMRALGRTIVRPREDEGRALGMAAFFVGFVLLTLAYMVPIIGFVTWALTTVLALGVGFSTFSRYVRRERPAPAPATAPQVAVAGVATAPGMLHANVAATAENASSSAPVPPPGQPATFTQGLAGYPRASFLDRVAAFVVDCLLVAIAAGILDLNDEDGAFFFLLLAYHIAFWTWRGTTLGGIVCSLRVIRTHGVGLRFGDALVRGLSGLLSLAALGLGCFWMLQDRERQMWHDKIAGTLVVKVPRELVLE